MASKESYPGINRRVGKKLQKYLVVSEGRYGDHHLNLMKGGSRMTGIGADESKLTGLILNSRVF